MQTLRIGILMGGSSREREISFAGGRTVYDTLDRTRFSPVPVFIDGRRNFILLSEALLYQGTIRDFFPPSDLIPDRRFQYSAEHISEDIKIIDSVGQKIEPSDLKSIIDFAFLTLHGSFGEDGTIQGLLEWLGIPYSGTGIFGSALGADKIRVRETMEQNAFAVPAYDILGREEWFSAEQEAKKALTEKILTRTGKPYIVKNPIQGSSIGISSGTDETDFEKVINECFFEAKIDLNEWKDLSESEQIRRINLLTDARTEIGLPVRAHFSSGENVIIRSPENLFELLKNRSDSEVTLTAHDRPDRLLIESFLRGTELSVIVIEDETGRPVALPPTEIVKNQAVFDYRDKYLAGSVHKYTPARLRESVLFSVQQEAERLFEVCNFNVFARIDGIYSDGQIFFNDPNTTSGMLPGSFLFHQAAEVGFTPTAFLTYVIETSLKKRLNLPEYGLSAENQVFAEFIKKSNSGKTQEKSKECVAVILGGYSSERHISAESGRNVFQKIIGAGEFTAEPLFLLKNDLLPEGSLERIYPDCPEFFTLWKIPTATLLKDNADDIAIKIVEYVSGKMTVNAITANSRKKVKNLQERFGLNFDDFPELVRFEKIAEKYDFAFLALHGRPGEDGYLKRILEKSSVPYNGSGADASELTMDKYRTNEKLRSAGFYVANHYLIKKGEIEQNVKKMDFSVRHIAKPNDEGCSTGVEIIENAERLKNYAELFFAENPEKNNFLVEEFITAEPGTALIEVTVGFITENEGIRVLEPSETVSKTAVLSLEEKFLAGEGQNITPAALSRTDNRAALEAVKAEIGKAVSFLNLYGYARTDAFVQMRDDKFDKLIFIEVNSLPGMTPATCIFHQAALAGYTPYGFIRRIIEAGKNSQDL